MNRDSHPFINSAIAITTGIVSWVEYCNIRSGFDYGIYHNVSEVFSKDGSRDVIIGVAAILVTLYCAKNVFNSFKG